MAGESRVSHGSVGCIDRISVLPDEIRECILGYLPICDAVRTSVLSQQWRYTWKRAPQLNICLDEDMENDDFSPDMYCGLVGRVLLSHVGPICTFVLRVTWRDRVEDMNTWLQFVSRNGIKDLRLIGDEYFDVFDLPHAIFHCLGLSCLTLSKIFLHYSLPFKGFPNLVRLVLYDVGIYGDVLELVISSSPLEVLIIERCWWWMSGHRPRKTAISAPNLRVLRVVCSYFGLGWSYLKYTPNLRVASFALEAREPDVFDRLQSNCFDVLQSMPKIEVLTFECLLHNPLSSDVIVQKLPELLVNLKTVTLYDMDVISVDKMSIMFCIMRSSPNLQTLDIHPYIDKDTFSKDSLTAATAYLDAVDKEEMKASVTTLSVTISVFYLDEEHIGAQTDLIGSIVSCCPTLEKLFIKTSKYIKGPAKLRLSRALRRFGRSSSKPKIIICNY